MIFIWINEGQGWEPHASFETCADDSSVRSEAQAEISKSRASKQKLDHHLIEVTDYD